MKRIFALLLIITLLCSIVAAETNDNVIKKSSVYTWTRDWDMAHEDLNGVTYGNNLFVAVGNDGVIKTSTDGSIWAMEESNTRDTLEDVIWDGEKFIVVGGVILTSGDGHTWTDVSPSKYFYYTALAAGNGKYIAVGGFGDIAISEDGTQWTVKNDAVGNKVLNDIAWNGTAFMVAGNDGLLAYSTDGEAWEKHYVEFKTNNISNGTSRTDVYDFYSVADMGDGFFVVVGEAETVLMSANGTTWITFNDSSRNIYDKYNDVMSINGGFKAVGNNVYTSSGKEDFNFGTLNAIAYGSGIYVAVGKDGLISTSEGYSSWKLKEEGKYWLNKISYCGGQYIITTLDNAVYVSQNSKKWTAADIGNLYLNSVVWDGKKYIAAGSYGCIAASTDGRKWTKIDISNITDKTLADIAWNGSMYAAVGAQGTIITSTDGTAWTEKTLSDVTYNFNDILWTGNKFIAIGDFGTVVMSDDGSSWTKADMNIAESEFNPEKLYKLNEIVYDGKQYVAVGNYLDEDNKIWDSGIILTSRDGINWSVRFVLLYSVLNGIAYNENDFVAFGSQGIIMTSHDGLNWTSETSDVMEACVDDISNDSPYAKYRSILQYPIELSSITNKNIDDMIFDGQKFIGIGMLGTTIIYGEKNSSESIPTASKTEGASSWAVAEIEKAIAAGLTTDKILNNYQSNITREEFCEIAVKLYEQLSGKKAEPISPNPFTDTTNSEILKAYNLKISNGKSDTEFKPNDPITRQELCVMIRRALQAAMPNLVINTEGGNKFSDDSDIAGWAVNDVRFCNLNGIIGGVGNNLINPKGNTTREQAILMLYRAYAKFLQ